MTALPISSMHQYCPSLYSNARVKEHGYFHVYGNIQRLVNKWGTKIPSIWLYFVFLVADGGAGRFVSPPCRCAICDEDYTMNWTRSKFLRSSTIRKYHVAFL
jgi:hypothetical protein